jgi:sarcosine oxidase
MRTFLHAWAREHGARLLHNTAVVAIESHTEKVEVRTSSETIAGDFLVVAAGSWLPKLFPKLGLNLSTERRVVAWCQPETSAELNHGSLPIFCLDADGGWYGMPTPDGRIKIGHDKHLRQRIDPDRLPIGPNAEDAAKLACCMRDYFMGFETKPCEMKPCIYTSTPDHNFIIDWHPAHSNVLIFSCCSGHGFKYAPAYGEIAADLIVGRPRLELDSFGLERGRGIVTRFSD